MSELYQAIHGNVSDGADRCPHNACRHPWHGFPCGAGNCTCETAFIDKYADEGDAVA